MNIKIKSVHERIINISDTIASTNSTPSPTLSLIPSRHLPTNATRHYVHLSANFVISAQTNPLHPTHTLTHPCTLRMHVPVHHVVCVVVPRPDQKHKPSNKSDIGKQRRFIFLYNCHGRSLQAVTTELCIYVSVT